MYNGQGRSVAPRLRLNAKCADVCIRRLHNSQPAISSPQTLLARRVVLDNTSLPKIGTRGEMVSLASSWSYPYLSWRSCICTGPHKFCLQLPIMFTYLSQGSFASLDFTAFLTVQSLVVGRAINILLAELSLGRAHSKVCLHAYTSVCSSLSHSTYADASPQNGESTLETPQAAVGNSQKEQHE